MCVKIEQIRLVDYLAVYLEKPVKLKFRKSAVNILLQFHVKSKLLQ